MSLPRNTGVSSPVARCIESEVCISAKTSNASFWIGPRWAGEKKRSQRPVALLVSTVPKYFLGLHVGDRRTGGRHMDRSCLPRRAVCR
jgi:hypothetical protein